MGKNKPNMSMSLDDFIAKDKPKGKVGKKKKGKGRAPPRDIDYAKFSDAQIKKELEKRGMTTKGSREKLVKRLKHCVQQAWAKYDKAMRKGQVKQETKKQLTAEEKLKITEQNEANRLAKMKRREENKKKAEIARKKNEAKKAEKAKRKLEHEKRMDEARERKRIKTEMRKKKQDNYEVEQKKEKEARQVLEAHAHFDMKSFAEALKKKLDPKGKSISSCNYDFSKKGFVVKFKNANLVSSVTKGSTINNLVNYSLNLTTSVLPAPIESQCVFFLSPTALNHPNKGRADNWVSKQGGSNAPELEKLQLWIDDAVSTFGSCGTVVNVYRERGFLVIQFKDKSSVAKFMKRFKGKKFNGVDMVFLKEGTPTKRDRNECDEANPVPKKKKKKN